MVLGRDFLGPQVFLHGHGKVGAAFHRGIIGDHHHVPAVDLPDASDNAGARGFAVIESMRGQGRDFQKLTAFVQQRGDPVARQHFAALEVLHANLVTTTETYLTQLLVEIVYQALHGLCIVAKVFAIGR